MTWNLFLRGRNASRRELALHTAAFLRIAGFLLGAVFLLAGAEMAHANQNAVLITPGEDIQAVVDANPPGTTFVIGGGTHRMQRIIPRDGDVFIGQEGAVLSGAKILFGFQQQGDVWTIDGQTQQGRTAGYCADGGTRCTHPEDLFIDHQPMQHVGRLGDVGPGRWFFDYDNDRIYIGDDPTNRLVETSVTLHAFEGSARDVTIADLTVEKYAGPGQSGAINGTESTNWVLRGNTVQLNHAVGATIGDGMIVRGNRFINNGQLGISGIGDDVLIEANEIAYNNYAGFLIAWEAGGAKFVATTNLVVRNNYVHNNNGPGLWTDHDNINVLYEENLVIHNLEAGIFHEISYQAQIRNNTIMFNSPTPAAWMYGAQILISSSRDVEVYDNLVVVSETGGNGVTVLQQDRGIGGYGERLAYNNYVHNNNIVFLGRAGQAGVATDWAHTRFWTENNNRFDFNTYYVPQHSASHDYWGWNNRQINWYGMRAAGQEINGELVAGIPDSLVEIPTWTLHDQIYVEPYPGSVSSKS